MFTRVTDDDLPAIVALLNRAYRGAGESRGWTTERAFLVGDRASEAQLSADLKEKPSALLLKWQETPGGPPVGCVWLEPIGDRIWYLGSFAADPERQNGGLGRAMLTAAEASVRERGGQRIQMTVINVREALIAWYGRRGYRNNGETHRFPYGDDRFGVPLRDDLAFVVLEKTLEPVGA